MAHPRTEHFAPLFVTLGAASRHRRPTPSAVIDGFWYGLSKRSLAARLRHAPAGPAGTGETGRLGGRSGRQRTSRPSATSSRTTGIAWARTSSAGAPSSPAIALSA